MQVGSEQRAVPAVAGGGVGKGARHSMLIHCGPQKAGASVCVCNLGGFVLQNERVRGGSKA